MIVDTSAILAIMFAENDAAVYANAIENVSVLRVSAASYVELGIVLDTRRRAAAEEDIHGCFADGSFIIEPVNEAQARLARDAHRRYGRGSGHRARLNFGDCFAYALARDKDEPLLFKGTDFGSTDVRTAL